ncbi:MAG TPA: hypothetical protein VF516_07090 [Kofleriaceae bacterium]
MITTEAPRGRGATTEHTRRYATEEKRPPRGWIGRERDRFAHSRPLGRLLVVGVLGCHLALVVAGAAHLTSRLHVPFGRGLRYYDALSGAGDSYSFFAPAVGPQLRARFSLSTPHGDHSEETLETGKSREVGFRLGNLAGTVYVVAKRTDVRRAFLGALAASRLGAHPEVNRVQVTIEEWEMPTMAEYRVGARPRWRSLHEATFVRTSRTHP